MRTASLLAFVGLGTLLGGCIIVEDVSPRGDLPPYACDMSAKQSITLRVRDERGAEVCDADVVVRDGASEWRLTPLGGGGPCYWDGPVERPGTYEVIVSKPGYETVVRRDVVVSMEPDGCHVDGATVDVRLERESPACNADLVPSFAIDVRDELGRRACDATVTVRDGGFQRAIVSSDPSGSVCAWEGPYEREGTYEVTVSKPGYRAQVFRDVVVARGTDQCATLLTAQINARLERLGAGCTNNVVEPFDLDVRDENFVEVCDANVLVFEGGSLVASLAPFAGDDGDCTWTGGPDRAGVYDLQVIKPGYLTSEVSSVAVSLDAAGCHAVPVLVNVKLEPDVAGPPGGG